MNWVVLHANPIAALTRHPKSHRAAVRAKCYACRGGSIFDPKARKWVLKRIAECKDHRCPLIDFATRSSTVEQKEVK